MVAANRGSTDAGSVAAGRRAPNERNRSLRQRPMSGVLKFLRDENGYFWYAGRTDDMMKVSGLAVWPADVESILASHSAVLESGVVGVPNKEGLIKPRAYVVLKDKQTASEELVKELQTFVKTNTQPHKYPRTVIFVDELPKTATGKIQRYKLRQAAQAEG